MKILSRSVALAIFVTSILFFSSCGSSSSSSNEFDSETLEENREQIQDNVTNAEIVMVGTITAVGTAPEFWSGIAMSTQTVSYTVDSVLKGTYTETSLTINHILVDGTRQAADAPGLDATIFAEGAQLIVFASQNSDYENLSEDWEGPLYIDVDPEYGTIPYSAQNERVIESMIADAAAQVVEWDTQVMAIASRVSVDKTLTVSGSAADVQSFNTLLDACKEQSTTLSNLVSQIQNSEAFAVTLNIVRNEASIFVDAFTGRKVDIKDLEDWHEGCDSKTDRCQLFGHILQEYWHAAVTSDGYAPSHASAIAMENQIRSDLGKTTTLTGHWGTQRSGTWYMQTPYNGYTELVELVDGSNVGTASVEISPPTAPTSLNADGSVSCRITLTWTDNASDEGGYSIERKDGAAGTWAVIYGANADATSWVNTPEAYPLTLGEEYCYRVRAWKIVDSEWVYSSYSNESCAIKQ